MPKKIKFPLKLKNDFPARSLDELKQHFDLDKIVAYFLDGKLLTWLEDRYYETEATAVRQLEKNDNLLQQKLAAVFGIALSDSDYPLDIDEVKNRNRRLSKLRQYTSDPVVLEQVDHVVFNQGDLVDLLDDGVQTIYLCDNFFFIPRSIQNKTFVGLGKAVAVILSNEKINFEAKRLVFQDIQFYSDYQKLLDAEIISKTEDFFKLGREAEDAENYTFAIEFYLKALENGNNDALFRLGWCYGKTKDFVQAYSYYKKAAELGVCGAMNNLSVRYFNGEGVSKNYAEGRAWLEKAVANGYEHARYWMGRYILYGQYGYTQIREKGRFLIEQAASDGSVDAMEFLREAYAKTPPPFGYNDLNLSFKWGRMAAEAGNAESMYKLYIFGITDCYDDYISQAESDEWLIKAADTGYREAEYTLIGRYITGKTNRHSKRTIDRDLKKAWHLAKKCILKYANEFSTPEEFFSVYKMSAIKRIYDGSPDLHEDITTVLNQFNILYALQNPGCLNSGKDTNDSGWS